MVSCHIRSNELVNKIMTSNKDIHVPEYLQEVPSYVPIKSVGCCPYNKYFLTNLFSMLPGGLSRIIFTYEV